MARQVSFDDELRHCSFLLFRFPPLDPLEPKGLDSVDGLDLPPSRWTSFDCLGIGHWLVPNDSTMVSIPGTDQRCKARTVVR
jgi:hypothetical protein